MSWSVIRGVVIYRVKRDVSLICRPISMGIFRISLYPMKMSTMNGSMNGYVFNELNGLFLYVMSCMNGQDVNRVNGD